MVFMPMIAGTAMHPSRRGILEMVIDQDLIPCYDRWRVRWVSRPAWRIRCGATETDGVVIAVALIVAIRRSWPGASGFVVA